MPGAGVSEHCVSSEPDDGTVNVQPSARPTPLPRTRRGMKRPSEISVHAATSSSTSASVLKCGLSGPLSFCDGCSAIEQCNLKFEIQDSNFERSIAAKFFDEAIGRMNIVKRDIKLVGNNGSHSQGNLGIAGSARRQKFRVRNVPPHVSLSRRIWMAIVKQTRQKEYQCCHGHQHKHDIAFL